MALKDILKMDKSLGNTQGFKTRFNCKSVVNVAFLLDMEQQILKKQPWESMSQFLLTTY